MDKEKGGVCVGKRAEKLCRVWWGDSLSEAKGISYYCASAAGNSQWHSILRSLVYDLELAAYRLIGNRGFFFCFSESSLISATRCCDSTLYCFWFKNIPLARQGQEQIMPNPLLLLDWTVTPSASEVTAVSMNINFFASAPACQVTGNVTVIVQFQEGFLWAVLHLG